jgi:hypothetical protein
LWDSEEHKAWAFAFADALVKAGVDATLCSQGRTPVELNLPLIKR